MPRRWAFSAVTALAALAAAPLWCQSPSARASAAIHAAESGRCAAALPALRGFAAAAPALRRRMGVDYIRCAMLLHRDGPAASALERMQRLYPNDAEVLYLAVHIYSGLAGAASQALLREHPRSYQVRELDAEALETQGQWARAAAAYRAVLKLRPDLIGVHFRLGRVLLSEPHASPAVLAEAKRQFQEELRLDPDNAGAEFVLGDMDFGAHRWDAAIAHFRRAAAINPAFSDAYLGWGRALVVQQKYAAALAPLRRAARLDGQNPTPHFYYAFALLHTGHRQQAAHQMALQRQALKRAEAARDHVRRGLQGLPPAH